MESIKINNFTYTLDKDNRWIYKSNFPKPLLINKNIYVEKPMFKVNVEIEKIFEDDYHTLIKNSILDIVKKMKQF